MGSNPTPSAILRPSGYGWQAIPRRKEQSTESNIPPLNKRVLSTGLSSSWTARRYLEAKKKAQDGDKDAKDGIVSFVQQRFGERYLEPLKNVPNKHKNGFAIMAVCCLFIEMLQSFREGWPDTSNRGRSELAFCKFITHRDSRLAVLSGYASDFYKHVRCGILHQGETTGGWKVHRSGRRLFDPKGPTLNASRFLVAMELALRDYCDDLRQAEWDSVIWKNLR